jgi:4-amino-4-deoxy-L-arabinose transferase-like glycosyltransferase
MTQAPQVTSIGNTDTSPALPVLADPPPVGAPAPSLLRPFVWITMTALIVRVLWVSFAQVTPIGDHYGYDRTAVHWLETGEYRSTLADIEYRVGRPAVLADKLPPPVLAYRTPGYILFIAAIYKLCGHNWGAVAAVQAVLGALTAGLVTVMAGRLVSRAAGILAGLIYTFWPTAIAYVPVVASDDVAVFLLVLGLLTLYAMHRAGRTTGVLLATAAGLIYGAMFLTRPVSLFFLPAWTVLALYDPLLRRWRPRYLLICGVAAALLVSPWFIRNYRLGYGLTTISTQGGYAMWWGNNWASRDGGEAPPRFPGDRELSEIEQHHFFGQKAMEWIRSDPQRFLQLSLVRLVRMLGTQHDTWACKYFWPTAANDRLMCAAFFKAGYPPEEVRAGQALERRNRVAESWFRTALAPAMLVALLLGLRRLRTYFYLYLPLAGYMGGLALTAFAGRYRVVSDPLLLILLTALLLDIIRGTRHLGGWGGRWPKLVLLLLAIAVTTRAQATGSIRELYRLGPGHAPPPSLAESVATMANIDLRAARNVHKTSSSACETTLTVQDDGLACALHALGERTGYPYGGVRIPVRDFGGAELELTWQHPENIELVVVEAVAAPDVDAPAAQAPAEFRWEWRMGERSAPPPADLRQTYTLLPGRASGPFRFVAPKPKPGERGPAAATANDPADVDTLRLLVRVRSGTDAGFTLHRLVIGAPVSAKAALPPGKLVPVGPGKLEHVQYPASKNCTVDAARTADHLRVLVQGQADATGRQFAGVRFRVPPTSAVRIELAIGQPENIDTLFAVGYDADGREVARWEWPVAAGHVAPAADARGTYWFVSERNAGYFVRRPTDDAGVAAEFALLTRVKTGRAASLTLYTVGTIQAAGTPTPAVPEPAEPNQADADAAVPDADATVPDADDARAR